MQQHEEVFLLWEFQLFIFPCFILFLNYLNCLFFLILHLLWFIHLLHFLQLSSLLYQFLPHPELKQRLLALSFIIHS